MPKEKKKSEVQKPSDVKIVRFVRSLPVLLTPEELLSRGDRAAYLDRREEELRAAANNAKSDYNHQIETVVAERRSIQERIRTKQEHREVDCEERHEYRTGRVLEIRTDTGEQIGERPMTDSERQKKHPAVPLVDPKLRERILKELGPDVLTRDELGDRLGEKGTVVASAIRELIADGTLTREDVDQVFCVRATKE